MKTIKWVLAAIFQPSINEVYRAIDNYYEKAEALEKNAPLYGYTTPDITVISNE